MVEYKVLGKNKKELAKDYIENHLGEEIKLQNGKVITGWVSEKTKSTNETIYVTVDYKNGKDIFGMYFLNDIANVLYRMSR